MSPGEIEDVINAIQMEVERRQNLAAGYDLGTAGVND
jgi:hypothetical protein